MPNVGDRKAMGPGPVSPWRGLLDLPKDHPLKALIVTLGVALICSTLVTGSAVLLRPMQIANKEAERQRQLVTDILLQLEGADDVAAGRLDVEARVIDLASGDYVPSIEPRLYDQLREARDPESRIDIPDEFDIAGLRTRERFAVVYEVRQGGQTKLLILPVRGLGYGSMLYGYLGLAEDANTIVGLSFYEHGETPGLGALIDAPDWKAQWRDKKLRDENGVLRIGVGQGQLAPDTPEARYQVDGLIGATKTSIGVTNLLQYWLGEHGFGPFLRKFQAERG